MQLRQIGKKNITCFSLRKWSGIILVMTCFVMIAGCRTGELPKLTFKQKKLLKAIGAKLTPEKNIELNGILVDRRSKEVSFPARLNMWEGVLELVVCMPGGRDHEALLISDTDPIELQLLLVLLGAKNGTADPELKIPMGTIFEIEILSEYGSRIPVEEWIIDDNTGSNMKKQKWVFVGTGFDSNGNCLARKEGNLIEINSLDKNTIIEPEYSEYITKRQFSANTREIMRTVDDYNLDTESADYSIPVRVYLIPEENFDQRKKIDINEQLKDKRWH